MPNPNTLNMFLHCHLTFTASNKKSVNNTYPFVLLYIMCQISLAALKIFLFVCLPLNFSIYIVMFSENDFITLFGVCLAFWISGFIVFNKFGKCSSIISSKICLPLYPLWLHILGCLKLPCTSLTLCPSVNSSRCFI